VAKRLILEVADRQLDAVDVGLQVDLSSLTSPLPAPIWRPISAFISSRGTIATLSRKKSGCSSINTLATTSALVML
jgi:hypothetical protein